MSTETWIVNASPVITMAKAGYLRLFDDLASAILIPDAVEREILAAPPTDPARRALEAGWGQRASPTRIPDSVLEWGLGKGESAVLALALERGDCSVVLDDAAARKCARALKLELIGTLGAVLRGKRLGFIPSAAQALRSLRASGLRLDDETIRISLERSVGEPWD